MPDILYKVYKGMPKEITYMTFNMETAIKKYLIYSNNDSIIEMWKGTKFIVQYCLNRSDLQTIRRDIESIGDVMPQE